MIEQISVPALNTCVKMLREGDERAKALLLLALLDIHQSKSMRVNMKEPRELEALKKIDEMRRFSNKEMRLTKESMGALPKSSEYCGPISKKSYSYVSGIVGMAYNPFINEDIRDCFFDYEQAVLLRFWTSRIATIRSAVNQQTKLGQVLEEKVTAPSVPKSDNRVEFGLGFSDELLRTSLMVAWELMKPSWCPSANADSILRATQDVQKELNSDCNLRDLNIIYNLMTTASKSNGEGKVELPGWGPEDWVKPGSYLAEVCGLEGHICGGLDCVKTLAKQHKCRSVSRSFANQAKVYWEVEGSAIEAEMNIRHSETYRKPMGARCLVGSTIAPMRKSRYPVHFVAVDVKSSRTIVDQVFSVPKCVRLARMSENLRVIMQDVLSSSTENQRRIRIDTVKKFMEYASWNFSDFERQKQKGQQSLITMQYMRMMKSTE